MNELGALIAQLFTDYNIRTVTLGAALLGVISGTLSCYTVLRKQSLLGDAMSHATLPGVVLVFMLTTTQATLPLMIGAILAGWLGALLVLLVIRQTRIPQDSALGIVLAVFFGLGLVLLDNVLRSGIGTAGGLDKFLFGRAAALVEGEVALMAVVGGVALLLVVVYWKEFKLLSFDPDYASTLGYPVARLDVLLTTLIVVAVVVGLQTVGVVLVSAMLVAPAVAARQWTDHFGVMVVLAAVFGAVAGAAGALISSTQRNLPTGPTIVLCISGVVLFSMLFAPHRGLVWQSVQQQRNRRRLRTAMTLEALYQMGQHHGDPQYPHPVRSLQAIMPRNAVQRTLRMLADQGLTREVVGGQWSLTADGVQRVEAMLSAEQAKREA